MIKHAGLKELTAFCGSMLIPFATRNGRCHAFMKFSFVPCLYKKNDLYMLLGWSETRDNFLHQRRLMELLAGILLRILGQLRALQKPCEFPLSSRLFLSSVKSFCTFFGAICLNSVPSSRIWFFWKPLMTLLAMMGTSFVWYDHQFCSFYIRHTKFLVLLVWSSHLFLYHQASISRFTSQCL